MKVNTLVSGTAVTAVTILAAIATIKGVTPPSAPEADRLAKDVIEEAAPPVMTPEMPAERPDFLVPLVSLSGSPLHEEGSTIEFCLPLVFPKSKCLTRDRILGLEDRPIDRLTAEGSPRFETLLMVHPTDFREPEREVRTCKVFARLKAQEWGPMTTAGMAAEARFERYCGLIALARHAQPARTSRFAEEGLTEAEIETVPGEAWPQLGEKFEFEPIFTRDGEDRRRWSGNSETLMLVVQDVAIADFDDDGVAERLLAVAGRARGGSAGFSSFMLLEHDEAGMGLRKIVWDLAIPEDVDAPTEEKTVYADE